MQRWCASCSLAFCRLAKESVNQKRLRLWKAIMRIWVAFIYLRSWLAVPYYIMWTELSHSPLTFTGSNNSPQLNPCQALPTNGWSAIADNSPSFFMSTQWNSISGWRDSFSLINCTNTECISHATLIILYLLYLFYRWQHNINIMNWFTKSQVLTPSIDFCFIIGPQSFWSYIDF